VAELTLDPSQQRAVDLVLEAPFGIVTGGPGTGKTTTLRTALDRIDAEADPESPRPAYELAAPTGKASRRMQEATGRAACTVHRMLGYEPGGFVHNADNPLDTDLVVVDEASMLDVMLAAALVAAIDPRRTRLILVGDKNQLPSVGPGRVFADLVESGEVAVAQLTTLHRAAEESWVCANAPRILAGELPSLAPRPDFGFYPADERDQAAALVVDLVARRMPAGGVEGAQVLAPQNTGPAGTGALNEALQRRINPPRKGERSWGETPNVLRPRDRVIHTRNNYQLGVMNGEVGEVVDIDEDFLAVAYEDRPEVRYDRSQAGQLKLAYALTVHKSQGSEWPWVVVVCHSTHAYMLSRQLLYTALTRAKEGVLIVGDKRGLELAIKNVAPSRRNTSLVEWLRLEEAAA